LKLNTAVGAWFRGRSEPLAMILAYTLAFSYPAESAAGLSSSCCSACWRGRSSERGDDVLGAIIESAGLVKAVQFPARFYRLRLVLTLQHLLTALVFCR
jgi:hypothetical protein